MHDDRIGRLVLEFRAAERAAGEPVLGVGGGVLIGDLGQRQPLHADAEARFVHHHEHRVQAAVRLPDQPAGRAVIVHHAGGIAVDPHLLFDRAAGDRVARADRAVLGRHEFGDDEEGNSLDAFRRALDAGQHQVDDILGEIVLAGGDEDLRAGDLVAAVGLRHRAAAGQSEIGTALRLGEVHRAGPLAADELGKVERLLLGRAVDEERGRRSLRQAGIHGEGHVCRDKELADGLREDARQALAAEFGRR